MLWELWEGRVGNRRPFSGHEKGVALGAGPVVADCSVLGQPGSFRFIIRQVGVFLPRWQEWRGDNDNENVDYLTYYNIFVCVSKAAGYLG